MCECRRWPRFSSRIVKHKIMQARGGLGKHLAGRLGSVGALDCEEIGNHFVSGYRKLSKEPER